MVFTEKDIIKKLKGFRKLNERIDLIEFKLNHEDYENDDQKKQLETDLRQSKLDVAKLERYIHSIDPKCASVLQAVYIFKLTYAEISDQETITEYAAHKRRRKGVKELTAVYNHAETLK